MDDLEDALGFVKNKISQFGSDVANGTREAFDAATGALGKVFNGSQPSQGSQPTQQAPQAPQGLSLAQQLTRTDLNTTAPAVQTIPGMENAQKNLNGVQPKPIQQPNLSAPKMTTATTQIKQPIFQAPKVTPVKIANMNPKVQPNAFKAYQPSNKPVPTMDQPNTIGRGALMIATGFIPGAGEIAPEAGLGAKLAINALSGGAGNGAYEAVSEALNHHLSPKTIAEQTGVGATVGVGGTLVGEGAKALVNAVRGGEAVDAGKALSIPIENPPELQQQPNLESSLRSPSTGLAENPQTSPEALTPQQFQRELSQNGAAYPTTSGEVSSNEISPLNNTQPTQAVNDFLPRNADAERAALEEMENSGDYDQAVMRYAQTAGVDQLTAMSAVNRTLQDAGVVPKSELGTPEPLTVPKGTPSRTAKAAQDLVDTYNYQFEGAKNADELLRKAGGYSEEFSDRAAKLEKAMSQDLTPEERQAVRDNLENAAEPNEVTPKVTAVTHVMRQLNEMGYNVLDTARPTGLSRVKNYATRLARSSLDKSGPRVKVTLNKLSDLFNTESRFSQGRQVGKFISADGEVKYGTQGSAGLRRNQEDELVDKTGKVFKPVGVSTRELNNSGVIKYENDYAKVAKEYHAHVGKVKARYNALQQLLRNPERFGISEQPIANGDQEIRGVPELEGKYAPRKVAKQIEDTFKAPDTRSFGERMFSGVNHTVTQFIVMNPLFHGRNLNQLAGMAAGKVSPFGPAELKASYVRLATSGPEYREQLLTRLFRAGGGLEHYGSQNRTVLTKALDGVGLPHINKINSTAMEKIDTGIRLSLFDLLTHGNRMSDEEAAKTIDEFMGDRKAVGPIARNIGMFYNYTRTQIRAASNLRNPGVALAFAEQAAVFYGATKAFQEWTGNKHATIGHPGTFGLINDVNTAREGRANAVVASKVNPVITAGANQVFHTDMYTGQDISNDRLGNVASTLLSPTQYATKVENGKASVGQEALQELTGASLPHVKGAVAVKPSNPIATLVNTKGAKTETGGDITGIDQATLYYNAKNAALKVVKNDPEATDVINAYLDKDVNGNGQKVLHDPQQALGLANLLAGTPNALEAVKKFEQSQPNHDPMWDLSTKDLHEFLNYEGTRSTDPTKQVKTDVDTSFNGGQGLTDFIKQRDQYYTNNKFQSTAVTAPGTPTYPNFQGQQKVDYNFYENNKANWDSTQKSNFLNSHPDVVEAMSQVGKYYNDLGVAQGGNAQKTTPGLTQSQEQALKYYDTLPKSTGARSAWIKANPGLWSQITSALANVDLSNLEQAGAKAMYVGEGTPASMLGDIYNLGQYDIAKTNNGYELNPGLAYSQGKSSSSSKKSPYVTLPAFPKKHKVYVEKLHKENVHKIKIAKKSPKIQIKRTEVLKKTKIGRAGPLKIR